MSGRLRCGFVLVEGMVKGFEHNTPERRAFAAHLERVAAALRAIEWVDEGHYEIGEENEAIRACIGEEVIG